MGRRRRRESLYPGVSVAAREAIERRWHPRMTRAPRLAGMVTAEGARSEPIHRWMHYRQGFSPDLVRAFLREAQGLDLRRANAPVLDPFSGSGTFVVECARRHVRALGVEALHSLVFLSSVVGEKEVPELPDLGDATTWEQAAGRLERPIHRAALMYAVGRQHNVAGQPHPRVPPLLDILGEVTRMMREDLRNPLPFVNPVWQGDARRLEGIETGSMAGILTSPPYLSRHDYTKISRPYEMVHRHWYGQPSGTERSADQLPAHPGAKLGRSATSPLPEAVASVVEEACASLTAGGETRLAQVVRGYFQDMAIVVTQIRRVLRSGAPCWLVIGGARLKGVYIPADLIVADLALANGLRVREVREARRLIDVGRQLGRLAHVAPRESILELEKL